MTGSEMTGRTLNCWMHIGNSSHTHRRFRTINLKAGQRLEVKEIETENVDLET